MKRILTFIVAIMISLVSFSPQQACAQYKNPSNAEIFNKVEEHISSVLPGFTSLNNPAEPIKAKRIRIFQVLTKDCAAALAFANPKDTDYDSLDGFLVLLLDFTGQQFYDDQIIKLPPKNMLFQVGRYQYTTVENKMKTVPAVIIGDSTESKKI